MAREGGRRPSRTVVSGVVYITSTFNNTTILVTDVQGNALAWSTAGLVGFSGSKQSTPYAAQIAAEDVAKKLQPFGVKSLEVLMKGPGSGKEAVVRSLHSAGFNISSMRDVTPMPHNGCKPRKQRRI
ncbi:30S ribosomal protein S11 [Candidatus Hydrogenosomobacter endosymbioticus]|uniref:Small ribosomal subunit protein uS11 n=1 Tax=Candidatus Hydrogenosomobacter endosymbioticus TaxID=2558174 RepID=A0ABM7V8V0_9PROT|nr:30S ribosomal protein S11 [Candidatus Hydrogenosomobacter endosymbioticus]BDB96229.1 30S ribosomal protein S11 [Candidatus Hydrogenosomobacter endosymbioticus]